MKANKLILLSLSLLLAGCGKADTGEVKSESGVEEESIDSSLTEFRALEGVSFGVKTEDYDSAVIFQPSLMNSNDDTLYYGNVIKNIDSISANYDYNEGDYKTPYLFSDESDTSINYSYPNQNQVDYDSGVCSATINQFELYKSYEYLYEVAVPTSRSSEKVLSDGSTKYETRSIASISDLSDFANLLDSVKFIHTNNFTLTGEIEDISKGEYFKKYVTVRVQTLDGATLYGVAAVLEYNDKQYFYLYGDDAEPSSKDIYELVNSIKPSNNDNPNILFDETEEYYGETGYSFDTNGSAGTFNAPGYFRDEEIAGNVYSDALTYVPMNQRLPEAPITFLPDNYGSTEYLLKNEYLNIALTYNNLMLSDNMAGENEFLMEYFCTIPGDIGTERREYLEYGAEDTSSIVRLGTVKDSDGEDWNKYLIRSSYLDQYYNYPQIYPYGNTAIVYTKQKDRYINVMTITCGIENWYYNEDFVNRFDKIINSFRKCDSNTELPTVPLTFYYIDIDSGEQEEQTEADKATSSDATQKGTNNNIFKELGITQEDIDNAQVVPTE